MLKFIKSLFKSEEEIQEIELKENELLPWIIEKENNAVRMESEINNFKHQTSPGHYVNIKIVEYGMNASIIFNVPNSAIVFDGKRNYVYVVTNNVAKNNMYT